MQEWHADAFRCSSQSLCGSFPRPNYPSSCKQAVTGGSQAGEQGEEYKPKVTHEEEGDGSTSSPSCALWLAERQHLELLQVPKQIISQLHCATAIRDDSSIPFPIPFLSATLAFPSSLLSFHCCH